MTDTGTQPQPGPVEPAASRGRPPGLEAPCSVEPTTLLESLRRLTDGELVARVEALARREHGDTALLVAHLAELDTRDWFLRAGYSSLFTYCRDALALSEHESYNRIEVARAARRFPAVLELLASGAVNLTTVRLLAPHLTSENHASVLESARGKKRAEVEEIVARLAPFPEVPPSIRKLPPPRPVCPPLSSAAEAPHIALPSGTAPPGESAGRPFAGVSQAAALVGGSVATSCAAPPAAGAQAAGAQATADSPAAAGTPAAQTIGSSQPSSPSAEWAPSALEKAPTPSCSSPEFRRQRLAEVTPLAPDRYRLQCTIGAATLEKLRLAQDMLRHAVPSGDEAAILDRAFTALLVEIARTRFAAVENPQPARGTAPGSRHVPAEVKRAVWVRDLGRCAFVGTDGRRCNERAFVEFHHVRPYAAGGAATVENVQLRCRRHNDYEARTFFDKGRDADRTGAVREPRGAYRSTSADSGHPTRLVAERVRMSVSNGSSARAWRLRVVEAVTDPASSRPPPSR